MVEPVVIILIGAPGSGKGTQSRILKEHYGIAHVSTGDMLRHEISIESQLGLKIKDTLEKGYLIDDVLMTELLKNRLSQEDCNQGFILDGYPRTNNQARLLDLIFSDKKIQKYFVFEIDVPEETILKRILGRFTCTNCGEIYNKYFRNPKNDGVCDVCGSRDFIVRNDDNEDTLRARIKLYHNQSRDIFSYYGDKVVKIDGVMSVENYKHKVIKIIGR